MLEKNESENSLFFLAGENFQRWNETLLTGDPEKVAEMYLEEGELFGTVSGRIRTGQKEVAGYFEHFLKLNPLGEVKEREVISIADDIFIDSGLYDFTVTKKGREEIIKARFTYVWQKDENGNWRILHHHSAVKDETNEKLNKEKIEIDFNGNSDKIKTGISKEIGGDKILQTGFIEKEDGTKQRFTCLIRKNNNEEEIIYQHISNCPKNDEV